ncbi:Uncharacterised protein [Mycobacteroides abscessus subsp. abscessus]|nr:Uncharacterised protein [Mycobacteroides abscessus subsp. abscessus]
MPSAETCALVPGNSNARHSAMSLRAISSSGMKSPEMSGPASG